MFDEVTRRESGERAARRGRYLLGAAALQAAVVLVALALSPRAPRPARAPLAVQLVRPAPEQLLRAPAPPPSPPAPPTASHTPTVKSAPLRQPPAIAPRLDEPALAARPEPEPEPGPGETQGPAGGAAVAGAAPEGSAGAPGGSDPAAAGGAVEEAPYPGHGFRRPEQVERNCFQRAIRLPRDLAGFAAGRVTVELVIDREGKPGRFQLVGPVADPRIAAAIWQAVQGCRWLPGADPEGRPTALRVVYPIVFRSG